MYNAGGYNQGSVQMMQAMQAQMGSLNGLGNIGNLTGNPSMFFYMGNVIGLECKLDQARNQSGTITDVSITVTGNQIKEPNMGCLIATMVAGSFCIIPLFFMCCGWWQKIVNAAFTVPISTYQKLQTLLSNPSIRSVTLTVNDNTFDKSKADCLYSMLSRSAVKGFTFTNIASPYNLNSNEWSDFKDNMKPLKSLPIMSEIKWFGQVVL